MRFALAVFVYVPFGGMQKNLLQIARTLQQRGHEVTVLAGECRGEAPEDIALTLLPAEGRSNHRRNAHFAQLLAAHVQQHNYDRVVGFNKMPGLDVYYAGDSCFIDKVYRERSWLYRFTPRCRSFLAMEASVFGKAVDTHILSVSEREAGRYQYYYETPESRFHLLPPGISQDRCLPDNHAELRATMRKELQAGADETLMLALGSGFRTKGLDRSLHLLRELPAARLLVVGEDRQWWFRMLARRLGVHDRVEFLGGRDDVPALLQAADILLHPAYRENTGNVILEALVAGLPVVATDNCGFAHYINDADMGEVLTQPFSDKAYCAAVRRVLEVPRTDWHQPAVRFAGNADIYDRSARAAELLETITIRTAD